MSGNPFQLFLPRLRTLFGEPNTDNIKGFLAEYTQALANFSDAELDAGGGLLLRSHRYSRWPTIGDCVAACDKARKQLAHSLEGGRCNHDELDPGAAACAIADQLICSDIGRQAAREGWIGGLRNFCLKHRRLPQSDEIPLITENARFIEECAAGEQAMGEAHAALAKMAAGMLAQQQQLAERVLNEAV